MDLDRAALAALADDVGRALIRYAGRLREPVEGDPVGAEALPPPATAPPPPAASPASAAVAVSSSDREAPGLRGLGSSQRRVLEAVRAAGDIGATAHQVAEATGLKNTNTPRMLKALAERGLISSWGANPIIWHAQISVGGASTTSVSRAT